MIADAKLPSSCSTIPRDIIFFMMPIEIGFGIKLIIFSFLIFIAFLAIIGCLSCQSFAIHAEVSRFN